MKNQPMFRSSKLLLTIVLSLMGPAALATWQAAVLAVITVYCTPAGITCSLALMTYYQDYEAGNVKVNASSYTDIIDAYYWGASDYRYRHFWLGPAGEEHYHTYRRTVNHLGEVQETNDYNGFEFIAEKRDLQCQVGDHYKLSIQSSTDLVIGYFITKYPTRVSNLSPPYVGVVLTHVGSHLPVDCESGSSDWICVRGATAPRESYAPLPFPSENVEILSTSGTVP